MRRAIAFALAALILVVGVTPATALTAQRVWHARFGTSGANGDAWLTAYLGGTGDLKFELHALKANTTYTAQVRKGTCAALGKLVINVTGIVTDSTGAYSGTRSLTQTRMNKVWGNIGSGAGIIRIIAGTSVRCAGLAFPKATRISIPAYKIDLPVVAGNSGFPYCNVAMYQSVLRQPAEPGVTFIYAHARVRMFLPLLLASQKKNGAAMIGKVVYVYTSNSIRYTYRITRVRRHVRSIQSAVNAPAEKLWLQTSEGPNNSYPKLVIEAVRIGAVRATYAASHPTPRRVVCY